MSETNNDNKELSKHRVCGVDLDMSQKTADWFKQTQSDLAAGLAGHRPFYSHDTLLRHIKASSEIGPIARAYAYALRSVAGVCNLDIFTHTSPESTRISMGHAAYEAPRYGENFAAILSKHEKDVTQFECSLYEDGYVLNRVRKSGLSLEDVKTEVAKRLERLGPDYKAAYERYIASHGGVDKNWREKLDSRLLLNFEDSGVTIVDKKLPLRDKFFRRVHFDKTPELTYEAKEYFLPLYKAFHYALSQQRDDIGDIHVELHNYKLKIYIEVDDGNQSRCAEVAFGLGTYTQNPMSPLSGNEITKAENKGLGFVKFMKVIEDAVESRGEKFKSDYEGYLMTGGKPENLASLKQKNLRKPVF